MLKLIELDTGLPQFDDRKEMWESIEFEEGQHERPAVMAYIEAIKKVFVNGEIHYSQFVVPENIIFDWYASRNQFHEMGFFKNIWLSKGVAKEFPYELGDYNFHDHKIFSWSSPFLLGGSFAGVLDSGGPYTRHSGGPSDAKRIGEKAAEQLIHQSYDNILVFESNIAWSSFFMDVAWDFTWVIIDKELRLIHTIIATDTD